MNKFIRSLCFVFFVTCSSYEAGATNIVVLVNDTMFFPDTVMLQEGDTILWQFVNGNYAVQVSQSTWMNNGYNPLPGGLSFSASDSIWVIDTSGLFYFVSPPNAIFRSKGVVMVQAPQALQHNEMPEPFLLYPVPASQNLFLSMQAVPGASLLNLICYDVQGKICFRQQLDASILQTISLESLSPGTYLIELTDGRAVYRKRIQVVH